MGEEFLEDMPLPHLFDKAQQLHALADSSRLENVRPVLFCVINLIVIGKFSLSTNLPLRFLILFKNGLICYFMQFVITT